MYILFLINTVLKRNLQTKFTTQKSDLRNNKEINITVKSIDRSFY